MISSNCRNGKNRLELKKVQGWTLVLLYLKFIQGRNKMEQMTIILNLIAYILSEKDIKNNDLIYKLSVLLVREYGDL